MGQIEIVDYDPAWPATFERMRAELLATTGDLFVAVEHVGSTAVPGLAAKPIIDIMAAVDDMNDVAAHQPALQGLGFEPRDTGVADWLFFDNKDSSGRCAYHLHVVPWSTWPTRNERLLRDHLLAHPDLAEEYARLKRRLAARLDSTTAYTRAKTQFIQRVVDAARDAAGLPRVAVWEE